MACQALEPRPTPARIPGLLSPEHAGTPLNDTAELRAVLFTQWEQGHRGPCLVKSLLGLKFATVVVEHPGAWLPVLLLEGQG